ncbi:MAG: SagB/ThcOx family dehydrogenase [Desulfurococcaceae archaeon]
MKRGFLILAVSLTTIAFITVYLIYTSLSVKTRHLERGYYVGGETILLPLPYVMSEMSVEESILNRKSIREWSSEAIGINQLSIILWCTYGVTEKIGDWYRRSVPSAGATYPLEIYVVIGERSVRVNETTYIDAGVYHYNPLTHSLNLVKRGDFRNDLYEAALKQEWVGKAPVSIVIFAVYERTTGRYGERGVRYVHLEAGHAGQNIYLCSTAMGLGTVAIGAFHDSMVAEVVSAKAGEQPLYIFPIGVPAKPYSSSFDNVHRIIIENRR